MNSPVVHDRVVALSETVLADWRSHLVRGGFARSTIENYLSAVRIYFRWAARVRSVDPESVSVRAWFDELGQTSAMGTQRTYWTALHAFWPWAVESGLVALDPMLGLAPPRPHVPVLDDFRSRHWAFLLPPSTSAAS